MDAIDYGDNLKKSSASSLTGTNAVKIFCAYASSAPTVGDIFHSAAAKYINTSRNIHNWPENDIVGRPLIEPILGNIDTSDCIIADLTSINFNVAFEAGYAIARNKRVYFTINSGISNDSRVLSSIGIFDTFGYHQYENTADLVKILEKIDGSAPLITNYPKDAKNPIYIVELPRKNDAQTRIISRVKRARLRYRSFNAQEHIRLSGTAAIQHTASSSGVIVPIAAGHIEGAAIHNIRAAFVAGLATGLQRPLLLLQDYDGPAPLDVRDQVKTYRQPDDINDLITEFSAEVIEEMQVVNTNGTDNHTPLTDLILGDPMAENEMTTLGDYYLTTEEYMRVSRGEANMVVGRKGMGKTALFIQLRDKTRNDIRNIVVDLKPEGYQLKKLREDLLELLTEGSVEHLVVAFWEFLLYVEIANKILEKDAKKASYDHRLGDLYRELENSQKKVSLADEGDFSERLQGLVDEILLSIDKFRFSKSQKQHPT